MISEFRPPTLKGMAVVCIKVWTFIAKCVSVKIKKSNWETFENQKARTWVRRFVVEEVEKKQCWKCREHKGLEMFREDNATCNGCLAHREKWAGNNPEKVKELWQIIMLTTERRLMKKKVCNKIEVDCEVCVCVCVCV